MFLSVSDDPIADFNRYDAYQQQQLDRLPKCDDCGEPIQDDYYRINGCNICSECLENYKMTIEY
jgi:formylmethanofuran dehydrogenase subunit E